MAPISRASVSPCNLLVDPATKRTFLDLRTVPTSRAHAAQSFACRFLGFQRPAGRLAQLHYSLDPLDAPLFGLHYIPGPTILFRPISPKVTPCPLSLRSVCLTVFLTILHPHIVNSHKLPGNCPYIRHTLLLEGFIFLERIHILVKALLTCDWLDPLFPLPVGNSLSIQVMLGAGILIGPDHFMFWTLKFLDRLSLLLPGSGP